MHIKREEFPFPGRESQGEGYLKRNPLPPIPSRQGRRIFFASFVIRKGSFIPELEGTGASFIRITSASIAWLRPFDR
jgi:hypothetical protein